MDELINLLTTNKLFFLSIVTIIGLLIGSFLNVVRVRLPIMMHALWHAECCSILEIDPKNTANISTTMDLATPRSFCPKCKAKICWFDNIPLLSFIILCGKCRHCNSKISWHYPALEFTTAICSLVIANHFGFSIQTALALILTWVLIVQSWIDLEHTFLPDDITLPCLWLGLIANCFYVFVDPISSIFGAALGYLSLYSIYWGFKLLTGKDGMGYGDFKLLAMLGAWLGWQQLTFIVLISSFCGAIVGITMIICKKKDFSSKIPFGPYIAAAGWLALLFDSNSWYLNLSAIIWG